MELKELKTWEILEKKYSDYYCPEHCGGKSDAIMVLFHPVSGEYLKVRNYQGIEEFFQERGYSSYLTEKLFEQNKQTGEVYFQACRGKKTEGWFRLILCKRPDQPAFKEMKKEWQEEQEMLKSLGTNRKERYDALCKKWDREWEALSWEEKQARRQAAGEEGVGHIGKNSFGRKRKRRKRRRQREFLPRQKKSLKFETQGKKSTFEVHKHSALKLLTLQKVWQHISGRGCGKESFGQGPKTGKLC